MRDGHNGYAPSPGIVEAREAAAADFVARGVNVSADRVLITSGTSEGIELALTGIVDEGEEVLVPSPTYPLYTAVLAKIGAQPAYYRTDHTNGWLPDLDHISSLINAEDPRAGRDRSEQPDRCDLSRRLRRASDCLAEIHGLVILADEVYGDLAYEVRCRRWRRSISRRRSFRIRVCRRRISLRLARGLDGRRRDAATRWRARGDQETGGWTSVQPRPDAIRGGGGTHRRPFASSRLSARLRERAELTTARMNAIPGHAVRRAAGRLLRDAAIRPASGQDRHGFRSRSSALEGCARGLWFWFWREPADGFFRIVFLAVTGRARPDLRRHRRFTSVVWSRLTHNLR